MYLAITDDAIRTHSHGKRSLDDVVVALHLRDTRHQPHGIPEWLDLVGRETGAAEAKRAYEAMVGGQLLIPGPSIFAPCFKVVAKNVPQFRLGFSRNSLNDDRIVRQLEPDSPAALAGLKEGDKLTDVKGVVDARKDPNKAITLVVARPEGAATISFSPRGDLVEGYNWVRNPDFATGAKGSSCEGHW
jgi:predicted metalloprotease with PDZ domain